MFSLAPESNTRFSRERFDHLNLRMVKIPFGKARTDAHCQPVHSYKCQTWTTCLSCHFCSFFSNSLGGHTCSCSWHSAYEKSYSHVTMSCGCSWDLSNSETLCSHACDLSISTIPSRPGRHYRSGR